MRRTKQPKYFTYSINNNIYGMVEFNEINYGVFLSRDHIVSNFRRLSHSICFHKEILPIGWEDKITYTKHKTLTKFLFALTNNQEDANRIAGPELTTILKSGMVLKLEIEITNNIYK